MPTNDHNVIPGIEEQFGTFDLGLAAYLMYAGVTELRKILPIRSASMVQPLRFQFHLAPVGDTDLGDIAAAQLEYTNQRTSVEPIAYYNMRRRLHEQMNTLLREEHNKERNNHV